MIDFRKAQVQAYPHLLNYYYTDEEQKKLKLGKYSNISKGHLQCRREGRTVVHSSQIG